MSKMLPCAECGIDLARRDCEETTATVEIGMGRKLFGRTTAEREVSADGVRDVQAELQALGYTD